MGQNKSNGPSTLNEAIRRLENVASENGKGPFSEEFESIKKAIDDLKPQLSQLKDKVKDDAQEYAKDIDKQVRDNPWMALGIVGVVMFLIGFLLGKKD